MTVTQEVTNKKKTIEDEIKAAEQKLAKLKERKNREEARKNEKNQKAVFALLTKSKLDTIPADTWKAKLNQVKEIFGAEPQQN